MPLAGAGFGASRALEQIVADRLAAQQLEQVIAERERQAQLDRDRFAETQRQTQIENDRTSRIDEERRTERAAARDTAQLQQRGRANMAGVVAMGVDPATAKREIAFSSLQSGADVPGGVMEALTPPKPKEYTYTDPKTGAKSLRYANTEDMGPEGIDLGREPAKPEKPEKPQVFNVGGKLVDASGRVIYSDPKSGGEGPSPYAAERAARTVQSVDELLGKVSRRTTGLGSLLSAVPETDARNFSTELDTLKANIAFNELAQMREASKTGGALGAVSEREMQLLQSTLGGLDAGQSPENLRAQLQKVKDSVLRWQQAQGGRVSDGGGPPIQRPIPGIEGGIAESTDGGRTWRRVQ